MNYKKYFQVQKNINLIYLKHLNLRTFQCFPNLNILFKKKTIFTGLKSS